MRHDCPNDEVERLVNLAMDGLASEADERRLAELLRSDAAARHHYIRWMGLHAALAHDYAAAAVVAEERPEPSRRRFTIDPFRWQTLTVLALSVAALVGIALYYTTLSGEAVLTLKSVTGSVIWTNSHLVSRTNLAAGASLTEGTLAVEGEQAAATAQFADGTVLALSGGTEIAFSAGNQKRVVLRKGALTAIVEPQPPGRPLVIQTATAEVVVRGTVFALSAERQRTSLSVESGVVSFKRLADGDQIEVPARHVAQASFDTARKLTARKFDPPPTHWRRDYSKPPPAHWRGRWFDAGAGETSFVQAVPGIYHRKINGTMVVQYVVSARANESRLVTLRPDSVVRVRYRLAAPAPLKVFLSVQKPSGAFGGNFEASWPAEESTADGQWQWASLPLAQFPPVPALAEQYQEPADNAQVSLLMVSTSEPEARLEVAELVIDEGP